MRALVVIENRNMPSRESSDGFHSPASAAAVLLRSGYQVTSAFTCEQALPLLPGAEACVLDVPVSVFSEWREQLTVHRALPILWWYSEHTANLKPSANLGSIAADGILSASMNPAELEWAFYFGARAYQTRRQWAKEREQLLTRLEERKWIERAKGLLSSMRSISEAEAYDMLRKQAMNERRRIGDVAASVVNAYQLLHERP
ncbi:ANTAR domain-containing response regulator [Paenibacillus methanolicus]|uniref:Response regulator NasT n=1 Tax=Paenibacillus methanolicus TaxID=582686 RepID=A0A5S5CMX3_9BACL|nr:ANTAR domain-containing protein [Paenibacillus methanolicus]TYP79718.1 response regulator NasT [Paenibacillus methanolicus]